MKRLDRIKLTFTRNWDFPGKERLSAWLKPSAQLHRELANGIIWLKSEPVAIYSNTNSFIEWTILSTGTYEDEISKLIQISLPKDGVALDIGGNIGLQSIRMSRAVGNQGKVIAFEPLAHLRKIFLKNAALNNVHNITLLPFALSDKASEAYFNIDEQAWNQGTFSILDQPVGDQRQLVQIKVADELPDVVALDTIDLIKIDVEGFEFQVLKGLSNALARHKPRLIFEYDEHYWKNSGGDIGRCLEFLKALNYELYQVTAVGCVPVKAPGEIEGGNIFGICQH